jgi:hypothetical protein
MYKRMLVVTALQFLVGSVVMAPATAGEVGRSAGERPQIIGFDNEHFLGDHPHILGDIIDLGTCGNSLSSIRLVSPSAATTRYHPARSCCVVWALRSTDQVRANDRRAGLVVA